MPILPTSCRNAPLMSLRSLLRGQPQGLRKGHGIERDAIVVGVGIAVLLGDRAAEDLQGLQVGGEQALRVASQPPHQGEHHGVQDGGGEGDDPDHVEGSSQGVLPGPGAHRRGQLEDGLGDDPASVPRLEGDRRSMRRASRRKKGSTRGPPSSPSPPGPASPNRRSGRAWSAARVRDRRAVGEVDLAETNGRSGGRFRSAPARGPAGGLLER